MIGFPTFSSARALGAAVAGLALVAGGCTRPVQIENPFRSAAMRPGDADPGPAPAGTPEARAELAMNLAAQARREGDARALLVAARLLLASGTRPAHLPDGNLQPAPGTDPLVASWVEEARKMAPAGSALSDEAADLLEMRWGGGLAGGMTNGPLRHLLRLEPGESASLTVSTQPQAEARIAAIGDGAGPIELRVTAPGERICTSQPAGVVARCAWHARSHVHEVRLINRASGVSEALLIVR